MTRGDIISNKEERIMKKTRMLALVLTLVLLISLLPMNALAMTVNIVGAVYGSNGDTLADEPMDYGEMDAKEGKTKVTVKTKDYADLIMDTETGKLYEIVGLHVLNNAVMEKLDETKIGNANKSATITAPPAAEDYETTEAYEKAYAKWAETNSEYVLVAYGPHTHNCTNWLSDATNHWKNCLQCKEQYLYNNWHYDGDKDGKCDVCESAIVYYDITVPEVEGVKAVTLDGPKEDSTAAYNDKITVTVEAEDGYEIKDVRVYKIREDGTKNQIVRSIVDYYKTYEFTMMNFDCEIVVTCVKK